MLIIVKQKKSSVLVPLLSFALYIFFSLHRNSLLTGVSHENELFKLFYLLF